MKKIVMIVALIAVTIGSLSAQETKRKGVALGADRDTLAYIIASPFDNWWINLGGGIQTYIGNTPDPEAYWNKLNLGARVEVGKWLIPDVAVSLRLGAFHVSSQTRFGQNNPLADYGNPLTYEGADWTYYPESAHGLSAMGIVTFDWTNFLRGYEAGKRKHWHFYTPVGLGGIWIYGKTVNENFVYWQNEHYHNDAKLGDMRWNKELAFTAGFMTEYYATKHVSFNAALEILGTRGSLDDFNYNVLDGKRHVDWIPSLYAGVKLNLLKNVTKYNPYTKTSSREVVNHEFLAYGSRGAIDRLNDRINRLNRQIDSLQNLANRPDHEAELAAAMAALAAMQHQLDSLQSLPQQPAANNVMQELLGINDVLNLPSAIVLYELDKWDIDYNGRRRLQNFAKTMATLDDTCEFYIIGAADSVTGSIRHNQWLSEKRCDAAYDMLVNKFGANANQFIKVPVGGITEYEQKENNRMALVILRTPVTEEIVTRWLRKYQQ